MYRYLLRGLRLLPCACIFCLMLLSPCWAEIRNITAQEAMALMKASPASLSLLDVRTPQEFAAGHIQGAKNIDFFGPRFEAALAELNKDAPYVLYCRSGNRSQSALDIMQQQGFKNIYHMHKGFNEWAEQQLPVAR